MEKSLPPEQYIKSIQLDLFSKFITNDIEKVSNTIDLWESIPKYFLTPAQVKKLRVKKNGLAEPYEWLYTENGIDFTVIIQPALIKQGDGSYLAFFPGTTEELVEEALKKFLTLQNQGIHDPSKEETWVKFSLKMIRKELIAKGRGRNFEQIKQAIEIMNRCNIALYKGKKEIWSGAILQDLVTVDREKYIENPESYHIAKLPVFISHAINQLGYRQFNYDRLMSCDEQLARWIYKRLINRFRQASIMNSYHFMFSGLKNSGLLQQSRERDNRSKVVSALEELVSQGVIAKYQTDEQMKGRTVVDVKYTIYPSHHFISEQKAANKRASDALEKTDAVDKLD